MKIEKYNINIEREFVRTNSKNRLVNNAFPRVFGEKDKNSFITSDDENTKFKIKTPICNNIEDAYDKFEEITNVVIEELYKLDQNIWPLDIFETDEEKIKLYTKINFSFDNEFYEDMILNDNSLPKTLDEAYEKIKQSLENNEQILKDLIGNYKVKLTRNGLQIFNINIDNLSKCGISKNKILVLIVIIFSGLEPDNITNIKDEIKLLNKVNKRYNLKAQDAIDEIKKKKDNEEVDINQLIEKYREEGHNARYCLQNYKKLVSESVVIIKDAISRGIDYEIENESKSIVKFKTKNKEEFVIEGNKTDRDSYIFPIITDDKYVAKKIMKDSGLNVPKAILLKKNMDEKDREMILQPFYSNKLVVKPRNTNYGTGITVFSKNASKAQILKAVEYAFGFDDNVLIEEYIKGMEYRFLVVDGKCLSVAHRRIASVVGDGKSTIKQLIDEKNKEPWHFLTATPVKMDEPVVQYLKLQGYDFDTILPKDKRVFLRTNSNCSTGGESIDMTEVMPDYFKKIAEKAAKAFDAKICGVDIIIEDFKKENYSIIEINDNPGYSINEWPYEGKGEKIGIAILKLLELL